MLCRTYCKNRVAFPWCLVLSAEWFVDKRKTLSFLNTDFLYLWSEKGWQIWSFFRGFFGSAAGLSAPWYQWECSATAITLDLHWAWGVQGLSVRTSLTLHTNTLIWILPNSSSNSLTLLHVLAPGWQSFFPTPSQGRECVGARVSLATTCHTFLILCNSEGLLGL